MATRTELLERALDMPSGLIAVADVFYDGLNDLSGVADAAVHVLAEAGIGGRGLDVACGTGYFAVALTQQTQITTCGVDIYQPFIARARDRAARAGVPCAFDVDDADEFLRRPESDSNWDVVSGLATADILGDALETTSRLRAAARIGGAYLLGRTAEKNLLAAEAERLCTIISDTRGDDILDTYIEDFTFDADLEIELASRQAESVEVGLDGADRRVFREWLDVRANDLRRASKKVYRKWVILTRRNSI